MYKLKKSEDELIMKIVEILKEFENFEKPFMNNNGDIIIKKKFVKGKSNNALILTNIFI